MTNTQFILREKSAGENPLLEATRMRLRLMDGAIILAFLGAFVGLLLILSK
ncbi:MAG: hypothetical protein ABSH48_22770 [Verrucomicrobiota bacterium]|jgi:hypothetical protein